jgi:hypothetical protein
MKHRLLFVIAVALAVLLVEAAAAGPGTAAQPPDGGLAPLIGCTGVGQPCTMDDGCPGIKACQNNEIVCIYRGTGSIPCTACGQSGTRACTTSGPSGTCSVPITSQACNCSTGTQTCNQVPNGTWNACSTPATQACSNSTTGCGGTHTCTNNVWSACACTNGSGTTSCHTTAGDICGKVGTATCTRTARSRPRVR